MAPDALRGSSPGAAELRRGGLQTRHFCAPLGPLTPALSACSGQRYPGMGAVISEAPRMSFPGRIALDLKTEMIWGCLMLLSSVGKRGSFSNEMTYQRTLASLSLPRPLPTTHSQAEVYQEAAMVFSF